MFDGGGDDAEQDNSWKVRKSAVETIGVLTRLRPELLKRLYRQCASKLVDRFTEPVGVVVNSVLVCFGDMLKASLVIDKHIQPSKRVMLGDIPAPPSLVKVMSAVEELTGMVNNQVIIKNVLAQLKACSVETKTAMFSMLQVLNVVLKKKNLLGNIKDAHLEELAGDVKAALMAGSAVGVPGMKIQALKLAQNMTSVYSQARVTKLMALVMPGVTGCINKVEEGSVKEQALLTMKAALDKDGYDCSAFAGGKEGFSTKITRVIVSRIAQPPERLAAVAAAGSLLAKLGAHPAVKKSTEAITNQFLIRLEKDAFVTPVLRAFQAIIKAPKLVPGLESVMCKLEDKILAAMSKSSAIKQAVVQLERLATLKALVQTYGPATRVVKDSSTMASFKPMVQENTLAMAQGVLELAVVVQEKGSKASTDALVIDALTLLTSEQTGVSLTSLLSKFIRAQVQGDAKSFDRLMVACWKFQTSGSACENLAKVMASVVLDTGDALAHAKTILSKFNTSKFEVRKLAVLMAGEVGASTDLSSLSVSDSISKIAAEDSKCVDACAAALGLCAKGSPSLLPGLLTGVETIKAAATIRFNLRAIRALLKVSEKMKVESFLKPISAHFVSVDSEIRNLAAECTGLLLGLDASTVLETLVLNFGAGGADQSLLQTSVLNSISFCISMAAAQKKAVDRTLLGKVGQFVAFSTQDVSTATATFNVVQQLATMTPNTIRRVVAKQINDMAAHTANRKDLIVVEKIGVMTIRTDTGKDLRVNACNCICTCVTNLSNPKQIFTDKVVAALVKNSDKDMKKAQSYELYDVMAAQVSMMTCLLSYMTAKQMSTIVDRINKSYMRMCTKGNGKADKVFQACAIFADAAKSYPAAADEKYKEMAGDIARRRA